MTTRQRDAYRREAEKCLHKAEIADSFEEAVLALLAGQVNATLAAVPLDPRLDMRSVAAEVVRMSQSHRAVRGGVR